MNTKWTKILLVMLVAIFAASSAYATIELSSRSEEMVAFSTCDQAGSITLSFTDDDYALINANILMYGYARIRVTLTGTDIDPSAAPPTLCKYIAGSVEAIAAGSVADPDARPGVGFVAIDETAVEVSDIINGAGGGTDGTNDVTAFVYGANGARYFDIYITAIQDPAAGGVFPWIKVGLYNELTLPPAGTQESTAICANVQEFGGLSKLTCSYNFIPTSLTINTSDNEIGHFLEQEYTLRDCAKGESCTNSDTSQIELCDIGFQASCSAYYKCLIVEGDFPSGDDLVFVLRTNGSSNGANSQEGVYLTNVELTDGASSLATMDYVDVDGNGTVDADEMQYYYEDDGLTGATPGCDFEAEQYITTFSSADVADTDKLKICLTYTVDPDAAVAGTDAQFWIEIYTLPCGSILSEVATGAALVECGGISSSLYFPYVVQGLSGWGTGVAISDMGAGTMSAQPTSNLQIMFTLVDSDGSAFTGTLSPGAAVYATTVDNLVSFFGWTPAAGGAILKAVTNYTSDGFCYVQTADFGAATLARIPATSANW